MTNQTFQLLSNKNEIKKNLQIKTTYIKPVWRLKNKLFENGEVFKKFKGSKPNCSHV